MYEFWHGLHMACVHLSILGFLLRGYWLFTDSPLRQARLTKILPHVIDTGLLVSAIGLVVVTLQYPLTHGWVTAKVLALLVYIGLGLVAFRFAARRRSQALAFAGAVVTFGYIMMVAYSRQVWPWA